MQDIYKIIDKFIAKMKYLENEHVLGAFLYGSNLTGCADEFSDIDLYIILDDSDLEHFVVGRKYVDGIRIEYREIPIKFSYAKIQTQWLKQNTCVKQLYGRSKILFDKTGRLKKLREYTLEKFSNMLPPIDKSKLEFSMHSLDSDIEVLKRAAFKSSLDFLNLYFHIVEEIRTLYHKLNCISIVNYKKVYRAYTDDMYRINNLSMPNLDKQYVSMYLNLISDSHSSIDEKLNNVINFYNYVKKDFDWNEKEHRIVLDI